MIDQKIIIDTIAKHLDSLESLASTIIILSVAIAWAGIQRSQQIEVFSTTFNRRHAFFVVAALYLIANMSILILFLRLGDLVGFLDKNNIVKGVTQLSTHKWILNPFAYFGNSTIAQIHSSEGFGLLISVWWLCNASLSSLMDDKKHKVANILIGLFLVIGLCSMFAIQRVFSIILESLQKSHTELYTLVLQTMNDRTVGTIIGIIVGGLIFAAVNLLQAKCLQSGAKVTAQPSASVDAKKPRH